MAMLRQLSRLDICLGIAQDDSEREYASNPVKRGLVEQPDQWKWRSFRAYLFGERGPVRVNFRNRKSRNVRRKSLGAAVWTLTHSSAKNANGGHPAELR
jgi:hypothetical protein